MSAKRPEKTNCISLRKLAAVGLLLCLLLTACIPAEPQTAELVSELGDETHVLEIQVSNDIAEIMPIKLLFDPDFGAKLSEDTGITIRVNTVSAIVPSRSSAYDANITAFSGISVFSNPLQIVQMVEEDMLYEFGNDDKHHSFFEGDIELQLPGRYLGRQYAYILSVCDRGLDSPLLVASVNQLEQAGIERIPAEPEEFKKMLTQLRGNGIVPLAVYGSPAENGFATLLSLFGLTGPGEGEFRLEDGRVSFTKLSEEAKSYLNYVNALYREHLIPEDFLSLTQLSTCKMLAEGKCAMAVVTSRTMLDAAMEQGKQYGHDLAVCPLPEGMAVSRPDSYAYLTCVISKNCTNKEDAMAVLERLAAHTDDETVPLVQYETYPLFGRCGVKSGGVDPLYRQYYNTRRHNEKLMLDRAVIDPYYAKIAIGEISLNSFDKMTEQWYETMGEMLTELFTRYYFNPMNGIGWQDGASG